MYTVNGWMHTYVAHYTNVAYPAQLLRHSVGHNIIYSVMGHFEYQKHIEHIIVHIEYGLAAITYI